MSSYTLQVKNLPEDILEWLRDEASKLNVPVATVVRIKLRAQYEKEVEK